MNEDRRYKDINGLLYVYNDKGAMIEKYEGLEQVLTLPQFITIDGVSYQILGLKYKAFYKCANLRLLIIPHGYQIMEHWAIYLELEDRLTVFIDEDSRRLPYEWHEYWYNGGNFYYLGNDKLLVLDNTYYILKENEAVLAIYLGNNKKFDIPLTIKSDNKVYEITKVSNYAFYNCQSIEEIIVSQNIKEVGWAAFMNCTSLKKAIFLNDDTDLNQLLFDNCISLKEVILPKNIISIADCMFYNCQSLESLKIPSKVFRLRDSAFVGCSSLKWLIIPSSIDCIDDLCFYYCKQLTLYIDKEKDSLDFKPEIAKDVFCLVYWQNEWQIVNDEPQKI